MQTVTITGGDLCTLASRYLGDATQWIRIARQNGLSDPVVVGTVTLTIPDPDPTQTGGLPS